MEILINNTDLRVLANEVVAKLTAIHEDLEQLSQAATTVYEFLDNPYHGTREDRGGRPFCVVSADFWLAQAIADGLKDVREKIINPRFSSSGAVHDINKKIEDRAAQYARADEEAAREARIAKMEKEAKARGENAAAAENSERIVSDFLKISSQTETRGKGKRKEFFATVVFLVNGNVFEVETQFNKHTREFNGYDVIRGTQGYQLKDRRTMERSYLFKPEMTDEEIGKAAHALDCIRAALREQAGPVVTETPDASEESQVLEEAAA